MAEHDYTLSLFQLALLCIHFDAIIWCYHRQNRTESHLVVCQYYTYYGSSYTTNVYIRKSLHTSGKTFSDKCPPRNTFWTNGISHKVSIELREKYVRSSVGPSVSCSLFTCSKIRFFID